MTLLFESQFNENILKGIDCTIDTFFFTAEQIEQIYNLPYFDTYDRFYLDKTRLPKELYITYNLYKKFIASLENGEECVGGASFLINQVRLKELNDYINI